MSVSPLYLLVMSALFLRKRMAVVTCSLLNGWAGLNEGNFKVSTVEAASG